MQGTWKKVQSGQRNFRLAAFQSRTAPSTRKRVAYLGGGPKKTQTRSEEVRMERRRAREGEADEIRAVGSWGSILLR